MNVSTFDLSVSLGLGIVLSMEQMERNKTEQTIKKNVGTRPVLRTWHRSWGTDRSFTETEQK